MLKVKEKFEKLEKTNMHDNKEFYKGIINGQKFLVKIYNINTDNIADFKEKLEKTEYIAELFKQRGINVINAKLYNNEYIQQFDSELVAVYPWCEGISYKKSLIDCSVCEMIGEIIGKMHSLGLKDAYIEQTESIQKIEISKLEVISVDEEIYSMAEVGKNKIIEYKNQLHDLEKSYESIRNNERNVLCHRDTCVGNFMRCNDHIFLLDWERAGYEYPEFELFDTCLEWSGFSSKTDWEKYRAVVRGYYRIVNKSNDDVLYDELFNTMIYSILYRIYEIILDTIHERRTNQCKRIPSYIYQIDELMTNKELYIESLKNKKGKK